MCGAFRKEIHYLHPYPLLKVGKATGESHMSELHAVYLRKISRSRMHSVADGK